MSKNGVKIVLNTVVNGDNSVVNITNELKALQEALNSVNESAASTKAGLSGFMENFANLSLAIQGFQKSLDDLSAQYLSFDKAMRATNTMAGKSGKDLDKIKDQIKGLASEIPIARDELANGLYQVISNGVPEDNWISFLEASAKSAVGGIADLGGVVTVTSTIIKNYGLSWEDAAAVQDKIQLTAKNGVTSFEQLQQSLPKVTGSAAQLGVSIDELMATFATLTGVTGNTSEVATQMAAVFNALVKPSGEAQKMAAAMGIQFNAASIQAAGGLQNFLAQLDAAVKKYAETNNVLEQSVYGKLFGSAESLRALGALTGQLADKYNDNVASMVDSAGTMSQAYGENAESGEAATIKMKNNIAAMTDWIGVAAAAVKPTIDYAAAIGMATMGVGGLFKGVKMLGPVLAVMSGYLRKAAVAFKGLGLAAKSAIISTGIGAAILAVVWAIQYFSDEAEEAAEKVDDLSEEMKSYKNQLADISSGVARYAGEEIDKLDKLIAIAKDEKKSREERIVALRELKRTWPEYFKQINDETLSVKELSQAYENLKKHIEDVATVRAIEDKIKANKEEKIGLLAQKKIAEAQLKQEEEIYNALGDYQSARTGQNQNKQNKIATRDRLKELDKNNTDFSIDITPDENRNEQLYNSSVDSLRVDYQRKVETSRAAVKKIEAQISTIDETEKALRDVSDELLKNIDPKTYNNIKLDDGPGDKDRKLVSDPKTLKDFQNNISIAKEKLTDEETEEQRQLQANIKLWEDKAAAIEAAIAKAGLPTEINTLKDVSAWLNYLTKQRETASGEELDDINSQIEGYEKLRKSMSEVKFTPLKIEDIKTYEQLEEQLNGYNNQLKTATEEERTKIYKHIADLEKLKSEWGEVAQSIKQEVPADIKQLNTLEDLTKAISYYQQLQQKQSGQEIVDTQLTINALQKKIKGLREAADLLEDLGKYDDLKALQDLDAKEYKIEVKALGLDQITKDLRKINEALKDPNLTDAARSQLEAYRTDLQQFAADGGDAFGELRKAWSGVGSMESGLNTITKAVTEHADAWSVVKGLVDGALQVFDGITSIIPMIEALSSAKNAETVAENVNTAATETNTSAQISNAAAKFFAAHAWIPWVGVGIAAASIALMIAQMSGLAKFADGGIAYGPTLGLFGEYQGARNNPEVVAPLSKLRSMLDTDGVGGEVKFKIKGDALEGVLVKHRRRINRS